MAKKSSPRRSTGPGTGGASTRRAAAAGKKAAKKSAKTSAQKTAKKAAKKPASRKAAKKTSRKAASPKDAKKTTKKAAGTRTAGRTAKKAAKAPAAGKGGKKAGRRKTPLTKAQLRHFRDLLLQKRRSLVGDMTGMTEEAFPTEHGNGRDLSLMPDHPANIASDNYEQEFTLGLLESERTLLAEIDEALGRIEEGTYGVCLGSGEAIPPARLEARPWAKYTIDYARLVEKGLARPVEESDFDEDGDAETEDDED